MQEVKEVVEAADKFSVLGSGRKQRLSDAAQLIEQVAYECAGNRPRAYVAHLILLANQIEAAVERA